MDRVMARTTILWSMAKRLGRDPDPDPVRDRGQEDNSVTIMVNRPYLRIWAIHGLHCLARREVPKLSAISGEAPSYRWEAKSPVLSGTISSSQLFRFAAMNEILIISLISSFGLETIAESANETTFPMTDGSGWPAPGLDSLILGTAQPNPHQQAGSNIPDLTAMGMGEFLEWSQSTGRTGQYEAYQMGHNGQANGNAFGHTQAQGNGEEERRGRQY
jgi:hypothetical protein